MSRLLRAIPGIVLLVALVATPLLWARYAIAVEDATDTIEETTEATEKASDANGNASGTITTPSTTTEDPSQPSESISRGSGNESAAADEPSKAIIEMTKTLEGHNTRFAYLFEETASHVGCFGWELVASGAIDLEFDVVNDATDTIVDGFVINTDMSAAAKEIAEIIKKETEAIVDASVTTKKDFAGSFTHSRRTSNDSAVSGLASGEEVVDTDIIGSHMAVTTAEFGSSGTGKLFVPVWDAGYMGCRSFREWERKWMDLSRTCTCEWDAYATHKCAPMEWLDFWREMGLRDEEMRLEGAVAVAPVVLPVVTKWAEKRQKDVHRWEREERERARRQEMLDERKRGSEDLNFQLHPSER